MDGGLDGSQNGALVGISVPVEEVRVLLLHVVALFAGVVVVAVANVADGTGPGRLVSDGVTEVPGEVGVWLLGGTEGGSGGKLTARHGSCVPLKVHAIRSCSYYICHTGMAMGMALQQVFIPVMHSCAAAAVAAQEYNGAYVNITCATFGSWPLKHLAFCTACCPADCHAVHTQHIPCC
jgi:hypothetical protein